MLMHLVHGLLASVKVLALAVTALEPGVHMWLSLLGAQVLQVTLLCSLCLLLVLHWLRLQLP